MLFVVWSQNVLFRCLILQPWLSSRPLERGNRLSDTTPPPPITGGGAKYGLVGILLVLLAIGVYCGTQPDPEPEPTPVVETPTRPNQFEPQIEIPDEIEDAGPPDTGFDAGEEEAVAMMSTMRRVPRNCEGNLDVSAVQQVVARQRPQVRACYERALKQNNILQGTVSVRMIIGRDGSVDQVNVGGSLRDNEVFGCVRRLARNWRFPRPTGGACAQVNAPFTLTPRR
ncbi:MAG: outer membrane biosynthesis protein TonB [Polyangiales bacterium]